MANSVRLWVTVKAAATVEDEAAEAAVEVAVVEMDQIVTQTTATEVAVIIAEEVHKMALMKEIIRAAIVTKIKIQTMTTILKIATTTPRKINQILALNKREKIMN